MSTHAKIQFTLLAAVIGGLLLIRAGGRDVTQTNIEYMPDMAHPVAYETQSRNPVFASGATLQTPPEGTVARGRQTFGYGPGPEEAARAGRELSSPIDLSDAEVRRRGTAAYAVFCRPCHGAGGAGDGAVSKRGFPPPPSLLAEHARAMPDGQLFHVITLGQGNMPAYRGQIEPATRWEIIAYLRAVQERAQAATVESVDPIEEAASPPKQEAGR